MLKIHDRFWMISIALLLFYTFNSYSYAASQSNQADYVIVGVGTAGAVLAKMLSDDNKTSVIALHNGGNLNNDPTIKFSENALLTVLDGLIGFPLYETGMSVPQPNANNRQIQWDEALPLGGASAINAGAWVRGTDQVYAQWEAINGPFWSVTRITNIYTELEHYKGLTMNPAVRGFFGPVNVRQIPVPTIGSFKFTQAMIIATGLPLVLDYNDPLTPIGISSQLQYTQKGDNGQLRVSSAVAFLNDRVMTPQGEGVKGRKLRVLFGSSALKIIWAGNTAVGVEYLQNGKIKQVFAGKGVIISAGLKSSAFLLHSGVGPRSLLESLGIPVIFDNPNVGQGLIDQPLVVMLFASNPNDVHLTKGAAQALASLGTISNMMNTNFHQQLLHAFHLLPKLKQLLPDTGIFQQIAFLPDPNGDPLTRTYIFASANPLPGLSFAVFNLISPQSRGSITIDSPNPLSQPVINFGLFTTDDLSLYITGFQVYIKALNSAFQSVDPSYQLIVPEPAVLDDTALLTEFIKSSVVSNQCFQGHNRMAPLTQGGVVDFRGRVYGVQNLLVADDSIIPVPMDGTPMASAYLIAANIAKMLLNQPTTTS